MLPAEVYFLSDGPPVQWRSWLTQLIQTQGLKPPTATIPIWLAWIIASILESLPFLGYSTRPAAPSDMRLTRQMLSLIGMQVTRLVLAVCECSGCQQAWQATCWRCLASDLRDASHVSACALRDAAILLPASGAGHTAMFKRLHSTVGMSMTATSDLQPAPVLQAVVDDSKARKELGYKAHLSREEGLAQLRAEAAEKRTESEN